MTAGSNDEQATVVAINRYPVKGFSAEHLQMVSLLRGRPFPGDRLYAIENGPSGYDPTNPKYQAKLKYFELMRNPRLAALDTSYDHATTVMTIGQNDKVMASGALGEAEGRAAIEQFLTSFMSDELRGAVRVLIGTAGYQFMDSPVSGAVSLVGLASIRALAQHAGRDMLDIGRFRMNFVLDGLPPWGEFDLVGKKIRLGGALLEVLARTDRCAAINVAPGRGVRDTNLLPLMEQRLGHHDCGIYARVVESGDVGLNDQMTVEQPGLL